MQEYLARAKTPDIRLKLEAIVMSYEDRSVEVIAEQKNVSRALVASWIKAFNARGPRALEADRGSIGRRAVANSTIKLPHAHDMNSLRQLAAGAVGQKEKEALFALATLYEFKSFEATARTHSVSVNDLKKWRALLAQGGIEAVRNEVRKNEDLTPSREQIAAAMSSSVSTSEKAYLGALTAVLDGRTVKQAAADFDMMVAPLKRFLDGLKTSGMAALELVKHPEVEVPLPPQRLRDLAAKATFTFRPVLIGLAEIAEGRRTEEVVDEGIGLGRLRYAVDKLVSEGDAYFIPAPKPKPAPEADVDVDRDELLNEIVRWSNAPRSPFLTRVRSLFIHRMRERPGLDEALAEAGVPKHTFEKWIEAAFSKGMRVVVALGRSSIDPAEKDEQARLSAELDKLEDARAKAKATALIWYFEGATKTTAAELGGFTVGEITKMVNAYEKSGVESLLDRQGRVADPQLLAETLLDWNGAKKSVFLTLVRNLLLAHYADPGHAKRLMADSEIPVYLIKAWCRAFEEEGTLALERLATPAVAVPLEMDRNTYAVIFKRLTPMEKRTAKALVFLQEGANLATAAVIGGIVKENLEEDLRKLTAGGMTALFGAPKTADLAKWEPVRWFTPPRPAYVQVEAPIKAPVEPPRIRTPKPAVPDEPMTPEKAAKLIAKRIIESESDYEHRALASVNRLLSGRSVKEEADALGIDESVLVKWKAAYDSDGVKTIRRWAEEAIKAGKKIEFVDTKTLLRLSKLSDADSSRHLRAVTLVRQGYRPAEAARTADIGVAALDDILANISKISSPRALTRSKKHIVWMCKLPKAAHVRDPLSHEALKGIVSVMTSPFQRAKYEAILMVVFDGKHPLMAAKRLVLPVALVERWVDRYLQGGVKAVVSVRDVVERLPKLPPDLDFRTKATEPGPHGERLLLLALDALYSGASLQEAAVIGEVTVATIERLLNSLDQVGLSTLVHDDHFRLAYLAGLAEAPTSRIGWKSDAVVAISSSTTVAQVLLAEKQRVDEALKALERREQTLEIRATERRKAREKAEEMARADDLIRQNAQLEALREARARVETSKQEADRAREKAGKALEALHAAKARTAAIEARIEIAEKRAEQLAQEEAREEKRRADERARESAEHEKQLSDIREEEEAHRLETVKWAAEALESARNTLDGKPTKEADGDRTTLAFKEAIRKAAEPHQKVVAPKARKTREALTSMRKDYNADKLGAMLKTATRPATKRKYKAIKQVYEGRQIWDIGEDVGVDERMLTHWIAEFNRHGIVGLMQA